MLIREYEIQDAHNLAGTFAGLMDLYERNYIGMRRLIPQLPGPGTSMVSRVGGGLDLHLEVLEKFRYTSELTLTYYFHKSECVTAQPNLGIRVYHDARQAEVVSAQLRHWSAFASDTCTELKMRWRVNRFLYKWLNYCLHQGHLFEQSRVQAVS